MVMPKQRSRVVPEWPGGSLAGVAMIGSLVRLRPKRNKAAEYLALGGPL